MCFAPASKDKRAMSNEMTRRVFKAAHDSGLNDAEFARRMRETPQAVSNWKYRGIPIDKAVRAAEVLGIPVGVLVLGRSERDITAADEELLSIWHQLPESLRQNYLAVLRAHVKGKARSSRGRSSTQDD